MSNESNSEKTGESNTKVSEITGDQKSIPSPSKNSEPTNFEKIANMAREAKELEGEKTFMEPGTVKKNKRGRPPKNKNQTAPQQSQPSQTATGPAPAPMQATGEVLKPMFQIISGYGQRTLGPDAAMTPEELQGISVAGEMVLNKYFPDMGQYAPEFALVMIAGAYSMRCFNLYAEKREKEIKAQKAENPENNGSGQSNNSNAPITPQDKTFMGARSVEVINGEIKQQSVMAPIINFPEPTM